MNWYRLLKKQSQSIEELSLDLGKDDIQTYVDALINRLFSVYKINPYKINVHSREFNQKMDNAIDNLRDDEGDIKIWTQLLSDDARGADDKLSEIKSRVKKTYKKIYKILKDNLKGQIPLDDGGEPSGGGLEGLL